MKILAITLPEFEAQARGIAGPGADVLVAGGILAWPERARYDLVMIWLHPSSDGQAWMDGDGRAVLDAAQVQALPFDGAVVFLGACYGVENNPMIDALFDAGAVAVVAGPGQNYGGVDGLAGADVLATMLRRSLALGVPLDAAWMLARAVTRFAGLRGSLGAADALEYVLIRPERERDAPPKGCYGRIAAVIALALTALGLLFGGPLARRVLVFDSPISPIATSTPILTYTPWYTPGGLANQEAGYSTPTPCTGVGCDPTPGARITYDIYLPLVMGDYAPVEWSLLLDVDGETADRSSTVTIGMTSTITATNQVIQYASDVATHTLVIEVDQLTTTGYDAGTGSVITDTGVLTWTLTNLASNTLAELETYYTPITTTAYLTATLSGTEKEVEFSD